MRLNKDIAILLLSGNSQRFKEHCNIKKQFYKIKGKESFLYPLDSLVKSKIFSKIILVSNNEDIIKVEQLLKIYYKDISLFNVIPGGKTRNESVLNALNYLKKVEKDNFYVYIHDSARVCLPLSILNDLHNKIRSFDALTPAIKINDSIIQDNEYINRDNVYIVQTPQVFNFEKIYDIYQNHYDESTTDDFKKAKDASLNCSLIEGSLLLHKLTYFNDLQIIEKFID